MLLNVVLNFILCGVGASKNTWERLSILFAEDTSSSVRSLLVDKITTVAANPYRLPSGP